ncbi:IS3 family transposase [Nesterenkonia salmonea]|uniref:IS3 family transposase n=1 Tax=Nesterenkonia salmonea TaxID=1804987 RepID=A0A5R9B2U5_9MICC|nr:IS3 family transposase [Nesterenkonia salmonea]TLP90429.1 IS3 family transposase [Nesterenkonia salmonea]
MTRQKWRTWQAETAALLAVLIGIVWACALVGRSRATHHRQANPKLKVYGPHPKPQHPAELTETERQRVLGVLISDDYADASVAQVWATELDAGRYYCSQRTMHRILKAHRMNGERRRQAVHPPRVIPELVATAPNQVWSWDITKMRGPAKGVWYHAYVVIDIYSRMVIGWRIEQIEDGQLASDLLAEAIIEQGRAPGWLHADGGAAMTSKPLASLLSDLDVTRSHNRPRTSNDNPYSESQFKTMKYSPHYPERFASIGEARSWMNAFTYWYNHIHRHSGIGLHTPTSVHTGTAQIIRDQRQQVLDAAYAAHPERFHRRPEPPKLPQKASINDPAARTPEPDPVK